MNEWEENADLKDSQETTNLSQTRHYVLGVANVLEIDSLEIELNKLDILDAWLTIWRAYLSPESILRRCELLDPYCLIFESLD